MNIFPYSYSDDPSGRYPDVPYGIKSRVEAKYVRTIPAYSGNPLIECLPLPLVEKKDVLRYYYNCPGFSTDFAKLIKAQKLLYLAELDQIRFPVGPIELFEHEFYSLLCRSYSKRILRLTDPMDIPAPLPISKRYQIPASTSPLSVTGDTAEGTDDGIAFLGLSGTGKSTLLKQCLSHIPNCYIHNIDKSVKSRYRSFTQVLYLYAVCEPNSDFYGLYATIGRALDDALGNNDNRYLNMFLGEKSIAVNQQRLESLINEFAIGALILDEIENINFGTTRPETYRRLLKLQNSSKVGIVVVGTEDAYNNMFSSLMMKRRYQRLNGTLATTDQAKVATMVKTLFKKYPVFNSSFSFKTEEELEIIRIFVEYTHGFAALIKKLYERLAYAYVMSDSPALTADFVRSVAAGSLFGLQKSLEVPDPMFNEMLAEAYKRNTAGANDERDDPGVTEFSALAEKIRADVIHTVSLLFTATPADKIGNAVDTVIASMPKDKELSHDTIVSEACSLLRNQTPKKRGKAKTDILDPEELLDNNCSVVSND